MLFLIVKQNWRHHCFLYDIIMIRLAYAKLVLIHQFMGKVNKVKMIDEISVKHCDFESVHLKIYNVQQYYILIRQKVIFFFYA
jgi:hypothetical protein